MTEHHDIRAWVDRALCVGSGPCFVIAPGAFALDEDMKAFVVDLDSETEDRLLEAAQQCPTAAIYLSRQGKSLFP